jgi:NCAIR mutase (PurE)-related protein
MTPHRLREILERVAEGAHTPESALEQIRHLPFEDLGFAKVDHHRSLRSGFPEVIFGQGKTIEQIVAIARQMRAAGQNVLVTRLDSEMAGRLVAELPDFTYSRDSRIAFFRQTPADMKGRGMILVAAAGTADLPVAEEAALTAELMGNQLERIYDVGVAGIHRLFAHHDKLRQASVVIVVAGMEGALPSVVGGLVDKPVIAVPTSVGYGASFGGLAALLAMLNSCAAGVTVVNIDNGFGAGVAASMINRLE